MDPATCAEELAAAFHPQQSAVLAVRPADGGGLFRSSVLSALDRVCTALEDEQTAWDLAPKCLTSVPLMESRKGAPPRAVVIQSELPWKDDAVTGAKMEALARSLEFGVGDVMDAAGQAAYVHLPLVSYEGVDLAAITSRLVASEPLLEAALDPGDGGGEAYAAIAGEGPSARSLVGMYDAGSDGGLKEPVHLAALERFQERAEGVKNVAQTFTIVDELKLARQGLRGGSAEMYSLPASRSESAQLMLALTMSPAARFGPRIDGRERVGLVRVNFSPASDEQITRSIRKLELLLAAEVADGATAFFCHTETPAE